MDHGYFHGPFDIYIFLSKTLWQRWWWWIQGDEWEWEKTLLSSPRNKVFITRQIQLRKGKTLLLRTIFIIVRTSDRSIDFLIGTNRDYEWRKYEKKSAQLSLSLSIWVGRKQLPIRQIQRRKWKKYGYMSWLNRKRKEIRIHHDWIDWKGTAFSAIQFSLYPGAPISRYKKSNFLSDIQWI